MSGGISKDDLRVMGMTCLGHSVRRTANLLTRHYNRHLAKFGIEITQAQLLATIAGGDALSFSDIARYLGIERSTLTRNLKPLEEADLVGRTKGKGRTIVPVLTAKGKTLTKDLHIAWQNAQRELIAEFGEIEAASLRENLTKVRKLTRELESKSEPPD